MSLCPDVAEESEEMKQAMDKLKKVREEEVRTDTKAKLTALVFEHHTAISSMDMALHVNTVQVMAEVMVAYGKELLHQLQAANSST